MSPHAELTCPLEDAQWCPVSGRLWCKHWLNINLPGQEPLFERNAVACVPVVWPCSWAGHLDSAPGTEPAKQVSWGHWGDTGPRKGPSLLPAHRALCPRPAGHAGGWPFRGKGHVTTRECGVPWWGTGLLGGWEDTLLLLPIVFREAQAPVPHPVWGCHPMCPLLSPPCFISFIPLCGGSSCIVADAVQCPE